MSTVLANTITAVGGGGSTVKVNNDSTFISDDGAVTDSNLVQGLAKMWANLDGTGTAALDDSFNASGLTDNGTGDFTVAINNDMSNANYSCQFNGNSAHVGLTAIATGSLQVFVTAANDSSQDVDPVSYLAHGDLA